jgi:ISXO2-like transposase domain/Transposase zinc-ribbon domain
MAGHFLLSKEARDFGLEEVEALSPAAVHAFFARQRWGDTGTQVCPSCGSIENHYWIASRRQWRCKSVACARVFSVTSGTAFADHKLPLKTILKAILIFATNVKGISALALSRQLRVAYQTAFVLLHKIRESITSNVDHRPLEGLVHIDGAHISGRLRKPRVKLPATKTQARDRIPSDANPQHPNRRIVIALREVLPEKGLGAKRTLIGISKAEDWPTIDALSRKYVAVGTTIHTDELGAYTKLSKRYRHSTVNHSREFSTDAGVSNNQAESFFARVRRFIIGQVHRVTPHYIGDYINEVAWREDNRRKRPSEQVKELVRFTSRGASEKWCGYWKGKDRVVRIKAPAGAVAKPHDPFASLDVRGQ